MGVLAGIDHGGLLRLYWMRRPRAVRIPLYNAGFRWKRQPYAQALAVDAFPGLRGHRRARSGRAWNDRDGGVDGWTDDPTFLACIQRGAGYRMAKIPAQFT